MRTETKNLPLLISLAIVVICILAYYSGIDFLDLTELKTIDLRFKSRGRIAAGNDIVLAVIDEKSLAKEGKWVWPRSKIAQLVDQLSALNAKVIAFDIGFLEPDDPKIVHTISEIERRMAQSPASDESILAYLHTLKQTVNNDLLLANAIQNSKAPVVLGYFFQMSREVLDHVSSEEIERHARNSSRSVYKSIRYASHKAQFVPLFDAVMPQSNITLVARAAEHSGYFNMFPDPDGVVRWMPAVIRYKDALYAPLSVMAAGTFLDAPISVHVAEYGVESIVIGNRKIPTDEYGRILINYRGSEKSFPHISITDILNQRIAPEVLKDKLVIVGATAVGIYDVRVTPFNNVFPGMEIHANIIDTILQRDFMQKPTWGAWFDLAAIVFSGLLMWLVIPRTGAITGVLMTLGWIIGYTVLCQYLFSKSGWVLNLIYPLTATLLVYAGITIYRYLTETRQKQFIRNAFSSYLAPTVVKQLIDSPELLSLGGEEREITAFFSDVQGFTSISERLTPPELVELLNEFLTEMTNIILRHQGTVDKFEGDAIIAMFGAPNEMANHPEVACCACIEMQKRLSQLRRMWSKQGKPELKMRIGLFSGPAVVGNMGSHDRMDYTMMGDTVNTAARLEGVNKVYGTYTMIGESTYQKADNWIYARELDAINVVGKTEPIAVYELLGFQEDADDVMRQTVEDYQKGLAAYRRREWDRAMMYFMRALAAVPNDAPSRVMLERCNFYKANPPADDWNGAFTMTTK